MADTIVSSAGGQRGWVAPSLAVIALVVLGLAYSLYRSSQDAGALEKRVASLEAASASASALGPDMAALKTQLADLSARLGDAPKKLDDFEGRLASLEHAAPPDLSAITADLGALKTGLATLRTQIGDVGPDQLATLHEQIAQLASNLQAIPDTSQLEAQMAALDGEVQTLQARLTTGAPTVPAADFTALKTDITGLKAAMGAADLGALAGGLDSIKARVDKLDAQVAALPAHADLAALQARLDQMASAPAPAPASAPPVDLAPLLGDINELKTRVATVETSGKADATTVAALRTTFDGLTNRVGTLESANPTAELSALQASLGDLKQQIAALAPGSDLKALQSAVADLQNQPKPAVPAPQPTLLTQVFFDRGSFALSDAEMQKLAALAAKLRDKPREVAVMGFADTQGPAEFNRALSLKRASAVRKALLGYGIGKSLITSLSGLGDDGPPVATPDNTVEPGNRTVLIYANE